MQTKSLEITIKKEISPIAEKAQSLVIDSEKGMKEATEMLSVLNKFNDKITEEKEKITKPLNEALKAERARWKPIELIYDAAIGLIRQKMSSYQTQKIKEAREEEQRIASRVKEGKGNLKAETAIKKIDEIERPEDRVTTDAGMVKFRTDKKLKVLDESKIPKKYFELNEKMLLEDLKAGKIVSGAEIEEIQVPINFR